MAKRSLDDVAGTRQLKSDSHGSDAVLHSEQKAHADAQTKNPKEPDTETSALSMNADQTTSTTSWPQNKPLPSHKGELSGLISARQGGRASASSEDIDKNDD